MSSPLKSQTAPSAIATHWHHRSLSSVASDSVTLQSSHAHALVELNPIPSNLNRQTSGKGTSISRSSSAAQRPLPSPELEVIRMARKDSGYAPGQDSSSSSSRRTSTSSSTRLRSPSKRTSTTRPSKSRACRSSLSTARASFSYTGSQRPGLHSRHTTPPNQQGYSPHEFFGFPTIQDLEATSTAPPHPPPPATCQYWTSDSTRRLEYAAIDAANRGVRGFFIKMVPDCILPPSSRRTRFHCDDEESDSGSVRRYRLALPEEKDVSDRICERSSRPGGVRRWTSAWKRAAP